MTRIPAWFERRFDFTFPAELLPNLLARLRGTPARLDEALRNRPHATITAQPSGDTRPGWSPQEHAGHLLDLEPLWLARVNDFVAGTDILTLTDLQNRRTDDAHHNARPLEDILFDFRTHRIALLNRLAALDDTPYTRTIPHPRLKTPMRLVDHLYFVAEHDDHHLARIWQLVNKAL
ncbi:MAG: DinB family protein [Edaphobacter sp.]|uniref:DinB family protein n=1 Tax=Edaphobacter sp. TaxID=1934404 RepID=UPI00239D54ED|nr:DinB family protein [Edaphobacter sp.]MDE1175885.1 DinB family protein [Edaphobacter sp.]